VVLMPHADSTIREAWHTMLRLALPRSGASMCWPRPPRFEEGALPRLL
jgi:hypothetical protein